jgi:hypothetical protein
VLCAVAVPETMMILFSPPCAFDGVIKTNDKNNEKHADAIKTFFASKLSLHQPFYKRAYFSYKGFVKVGGLFKLWKWKNKEGQKNEFKV